MFDTIVVHESLEFLTRKEESLSVTIVCGNPWVENAVLSVLIVFDELIVDMM